MVGIVPGGRQDDGIFRGKAEPGGGLHAFALIHQRREPWPIQPKALKKIPINQRQQRRPRLTRRPWLLSSLPPLVEIGKPQGLAVWLASSGSQGDAVGLRLEQGDPCYSSLFVVKPEPFGLMTLLDRLEDVGAG